MLQAVENRLAGGWRNSWQNAAFALWGSVAFVAGVFALRAAAGAFRQELSPAAAGLGVLLAALVGLGGLGCFRAAHPGGLTLRQIIAAWALTVLPVLLLGIAICPASSTLGIAWVTVLVVGLTGGIPLLGRPVGLFPRLAAESDGLETSPTASTSTVPFDDPGLTQWMTRRVLPIDGEHWEQIEGRSTVEFAAGQQHAAMHLSICPPLSGTPEIECETPADEDVEWKVAAVHPYGIRLELRRPASPEPRMVAVGYTMAAVVESKIAKAA